jgi:lipopolysaccharide transport system permease protein
MQANETRLLRRKTGLFMGIHNPRVTGSSPVAAILNRRAIHARDLVLVLLSKELKVRYKNTVLGYAWSVLNPLAFAMVLFFVFKVIIRIQVPNYPLFLVTGLFPWQWFQNSVNAANGYFLTNASLIKRVRFPRIVLVFASVMNDMIHFLASVLVILVLMFHYGAMPSVSWLWWLPLLLLAQFLLTFGLATMVATANLFFRDLERLTSVFTLLWFYMTPITYSPSMIPHRLQYVIYVNPMATMILCWRDMFLNGHVPLSLLASALASSAVMFGLGWLVYEWKKWRFAEVV